MLPLFNTFSKFQISYAKPNRVISFLVVLMVGENPNCRTANRNATNDSFRDGNIPRVFFQRYPALIRKSAEF